MVVSFYFSLTPRKINFWSMNYKCCGNVNDDIYHQLLQWTTLVPKYKLHIIQGSYAISKEGSRIFFQIAWNMSSRPLLEKCPNTEFFLVRIFMFLVRIQENTDQKKLRIWTLFTQWTYRRISCRYFRICDKWNTIMFTSSVLYFL